MNEKSETENKLRQRSQRQAFYISQLKTQIPEDGFSQTQSIEEKLDALKDEIENIRMHIAESIQDALSKFLQETQMKRDESHTTFQSVCTQTTQGAPDRGVLGEIEEGFSASTQPKALNSVEKTRAYKEPSRRTAMIKRYEEDNPYDNVTLKSPMTSEFGTHSLQIRDMPVAVKPRPKSAIAVRTGVYDERECLASALQFHVEDLVNEIIFHESELPDCLLAEGCLTEDECASVRKLRDRKDQVRVLLSLIKGRDYRVLKDFMKHIKQHNEHVASKIMEKFEENKRAGIGRKVCFLCQLKQQFNVKHLVDSLWALQVIGDGLYNTVIHSEAPVGAQETLWDKVINSINYLDKEMAIKAHEKLLKALRCKNLFTHLADGIQSLLIKDHAAKLACICEPKLILQRRKSLFACSTSEESLFPDSSSDGMSNGLRSSGVTHNGTFRFMGCSYTKATQERLTPSRDAFGVDSLVEDSITQETSKPDFNSQTFTKTLVSDGEPVHVHKTTIDDTKSTLQTTQKPLRPQKSESST